jgi:general stress protein YciG
MTRSGRPCRAWAAAGSDLCLAHGQPEKVREAGRKGGQAAREKAVLPSAAFELKSPQQVAGMLEHVLNSMLKGELDRGLASCAGYLGQGIIKALEQGDMEARIAALEAKLGVKK